MKLNIHQLEEGPNVFHQTEKDGWVRDLVKDCAQEGLPLEKDQVNLDFTILKHEPNYILSAQIKAHARLNCARCAEEFSWPIDQSFEAHFEQGKSGSSKETADEDLESPESEEVERIAIEGNEIDLLPIFEEQFLLSIPYQAYCKPDCKGICQKCLRNLNLSSCQCKEEEPSGPFSVLRRLVSEAGKGKRR